MALSAKDMFIKIRLEAGEVPYHVYQAADREFPGIPTNTNAIMQATEPHIAQRAYDQAAHAAVEQKAAHEAALLNANYPTKDRGNWWNKGIKGIGNLPHKVEKSIVRPVAHAIGDAAHQAEKHAVRPVAHAIGDAAKKATPVIGAILGNILLPGLGAPIGGAIGGASTRNRRNWGKGAVEGAGQGAAYFGGSRLGSALSNLANRTQIMGENAPQAPGLGSLGNLLPNIFGGIQDLIAQRREAREHPQAAQQEHVHGGSPPAQGIPQQADTDLSALKPPMMSPYELLMALAPKHHKRKSDKEKMEPVEPIKKFAHGGSAFVGHIKESDTGGQADDIPKHIPEGSYVMNATDVSLLGDGSTDNGIKKLREFESKFHRSGITKPYDAHSRAIAAKVSNDEYVMHPDTVNALGQGNNNKGAKVIDKMRNNLRKQKGVSKILPPKTKDLKAYMKGGQ